MLNIDQNNPDFKYVGDTIMSNSYYDLDCNFEQTEVYGTNALDQAIEHVLLTEYGERLFNPGFGSPLQKLFFENQSNAYSLVGSVYDAIEKIVPVTIDRTAAYISKSQQDPHMICISFDYSTNDGLVIGHHFTRKFKQ